MIHLTQFEAEMIKKKASCTFCLGNVSSYLFISETHFHFHALKSSNFHFSTRHSEVKRPELFDYAAYC